MKLHIVLVEPEIPSNTGNISRTCSVTGVALHLVHPLGFDISEKQVRRAGLDYWDELELYEYQSFDEVLEKNPNGRFFYCSTKAKYTYSEVDYYKRGRRRFSWFSARKNKGLPEPLLHKNYDSCIRIPMRENMRSLNLPTRLRLLHTRYLDRQDLKIYRRKVYFYDKDYG